MLGPNQHGQEILIIAEYLRLKQYEYVVQVPNLHGTYCWQHYPSISSGGPGLS